VIEAAVEVARLAIAQVAEAAAAAAAAAAVAVAVAVVDQVAAQCKVLSHCLILLTRRINRRRRRRRNRKTKDVYKKINKKTRWKK